MFIKVFLYAVASRYVCVVISRFVIVRRRVFSDPAVIRINIMLSAYFLEKDDGRNSANYQEYGVSVILNAWVRADLRFVFSAIPCVRFYGDVTWWNRVLYFAYFFVWGACPIELERRP